MYCNIIEILWINRVIRKEMYRCISPAPLPHYSYEGGGYIFKIYILDWFIKPDSKWLNFLVAHDEPIFQYIFMVISLRFFALWIIWVLKGSLRVYWSASGKFISFCSKASRAVSRMLTGLNGKSISFCTDKQGPICYQLSICVVDPQMTYFVFQTQINQANRHKVDHSRRGKRAIATR